MSVYTDQNRVRFANHQYEGFNDQEGAGFNGFPCAIERSRIYFPASPVPSGFPVELPYLVVAKWWWRVRTWLLSVAGGSYALTSNLVASGFDYPLRLCFAGGLEHTYSGGGVIIRFAYLASFGTLPYTPFGFPAAHILPGSDEDLLMPNLTIDILVAGPTHMNTGGGTHSQTVTIDGYSFPIFSDSPGSWPVTLDPLTYWAYSARDGSPIYDTTTGERLQSPLN